MGQAKHNPTAIAAKEGKLPPKPKRMGKPETRRWIMSELARQTDLDKILREMETPYK